MKIKFALTFQFLLLVFTVLSQKKELRSITENELKAHLEFIASDYMQGRDFGTQIPGLELTAEYLKTECLKMRLKPGGPNFTQKVNMISIRTEKENTLVRLINRKGEITYESNEIQTFPGSVNNDTIYGDIVFAGYGFQNRETSYNDYEGIDLKDKVVMVMSRNREIAIDISNTSDNTNLEMEKLARILLSGARAVLLVPDPLNPDKKWFNMVRDYASQGTWQIEGVEKTEMPGNNILLANAEIANAILAETGKTLQEIQMEINNTGIPNSFDLKNVSAEFQLTKKIEKVSGENIVAIVEGSDPVLKTECVVVSAHYDHVGITGNGEINNGADDNGSGTSALLEIAEAFSQMKKKPRRSIVFAWVTAEEKGLIGSEFYTLNPVIPLENTVANINLDMVGRSAEMELEKVVVPEKSLAGPNGVYLITGDKSKELTEISNKICSGLGLIPSDALTDDFMNSSDQYNFYKNNIPVIGISTGLHEDYHRPTDDIDKIDYHKMKRIADYTFLVTYEIANRKKRLVVDNPTGK